MSNKAMVLGLEAAAKRLKVSSGYLRGLADKGLLPVLRDSARRRLFFPSDIERFKQQRKEAKAGNGDKRNLNWRGNAMKHDFDWWNSDPEHAKVKPKHRPSWAQAAIEAEAAEIKEAIETEKHALINPHTGEIWFPGHPQYAGLAKALADEKRDFEQAARNAGL